MTEDQYRELGLREAWKLEELPREVWPSIPGLRRRSDTIAVMGSADISNPRLLNEIRAIGGLDHLVFEACPKPGEPPGNAYHYVIQAVSDARFPYIVHGPFCKQARVPHWFEASDLDAYAPPSNADSIDAGVSRGNQRCGVASSAPRWKRRR